MIPLRTELAYLACLLGGAVGDALGAPIEFLSLADFGRRFGSAGFTRLDSRIPPRRPRRSQGYAYSHVAP